MRRRVPEFLAAARDRGELTCPDPALASRVFLGAIYSEYHLMRLVLETVPAVPRAQIRAHVDAVVAMMLEHYAVRAGAV